MEAPRTKVCPNGDEHKRYSDPKKRNVCVRCGAALPPDYDDGVEYLEPSSVESRSG